jgi:hypothetical protein
MAEVNARLFEISSKKLLMEMSPYDDNFFKNCFDLPISMTPEQVVKAIEEADAFEDGRTSKPNHILQNQIRKVAYRMINREEFTNQPVFIDYREINGQITWQPQTLDDAALLAARLLAKEATVDVAISSDVTEKLTNSNTDTDSNTEHSQERALSMLGLKAENGTTLVIHDIRGEGFSFDWSFSKNDKYQQWNDKEFLKQQLQDNKNFKNISLYTDKAIWSDSAFMIEVLNLKTDLISAKEGSEYLLPRENLFNIEIFEALQNNEDEKVLDLWWTHFLPEFKKSVASSYLQDVYTGDGNKKKSAKEKDKEDKKEKNSIESTEPEYVEQLAEYLHRYYFDQVKAGIRFMEKNNYRTWLYCMSEDVRNNPVFVDALYNKAKTAKWPMDLYDYLTEKHWENDDNKLRYLQEKNGYMNVRFREAHYPFLKNLVKDKESLMQCATQWKENAFELYRYASASLQRESEVIDAMFAINPQFYRFLPEKLKKNWNYAKQYFNAETMSVREIPLETLFAQKDKAVIEKAIGLDKKLLNELKCPKHWREDEALMLSVASYLPELRYAMPTMWKKFSSDMEICKKLVDASIYNYIKLTPEARKSDELINMVIEKGSYFNSEDNKTKELQDSIPAQKWINKQFCFKALHKNYLWIEKVPQPYWQDPAFITELCRRADSKHFQEKIDTKVFSFAPEQVRNFIANYDLKNNFSDLIGKALLQSKLEQHLIQDKTDKTPQPVSIPIPVPTSLTVPAQESLSADKTIQPVPTQVEEDIATELPKHDAPLKI